MKVTLAFRDMEARSILYYLRRRYNSKAMLTSLAKKAIRREVGAEAQIELDEVNRNLMATED